MHAAGGGASHGGLPAFSQRPMSASSSANLEVDGRDGGVGGGLSYGGPPPQPPQAAHPGCRPSNLPTDPTAFHGGRLSTAPLHLGSHGCLQLDQVPRSATALPHQTTCVPAKAGKAACRAASL